MQFFRQLPLLKGFCTNSRLKYQNKRYFTKIAAVLDLKPVGSRVTVQGWIQSKRKMKSNLFIDVSDGSSSDRLQIILARDITQQLDVGASIRVAGIIQTCGQNGQIELFAENVEAIGPCKYEDGYPFVPKRSHSMEHLRQNLHFRPRTNIFGSILRIRSKAAHAFRSHLSNEGFFEVHAPILTSCDCEGAGEIFSVNPDSDDLLKQMSKKDVPKEETFFGSKTYLTVSGQMHLEAVARGLGHVYSFGPTFRAENSKSRLHLSEFYMLETEQILSDGKLDTVLLTIEKMLRTVTLSILEENLSDLKAIQKIQIQQKNSSCNVVEYEVDPLSPECIHNTFLPTSQYPVMTYKEAIETLLNCETTFKVKPSFEQGLAKEHELFLVKHNGNIPLFIVEWPAHLKAFYMKRSIDGSTVEALDLLVPVVGELCGGSVREDNIELLWTKLKQLKQEHKLAWYWDLRKFGNISTGGFGMGFERYLQCLLNIPNIKDVIPFPRWPHSCKM